MPRDSFDLSDTSDLPESMQPKARKKRRAGKWGTLIASGPAEFSTAQLRAAAFRVYGLTLDQRRAASAITGNEIKAGRLRRLGYGRFARFDVAGKEP